MGMKKEWKYFTIFNHEKEEEYLRDQHRAGWKFVKVTGIGFYYFEKCTPQKLHFCLLIFLFANFPQLSAGISLAPLLTHSQGMPHSFRGTHPNRFLLFQLCQP